jgi:hypothetical protein
VQIAALTSLARLLLQLDRNQIARERLQIERRRLRLLARKLESEKARTARKGKGWKKEATGRSLTLEDINHLRTTIFGLPPITRPEPSPPAQPTADLPEAYEPPPPSDDGGVAAEPGLPSPHPANLDQTKPVGEPGAKPELTCSRGGGSAVPLGGTGASTGIYFLSQHRGAPHPAISRLSPPNPALGNEKFVRFPGPGPLATGPARPRPCRTAIFAGREPATDDRELSPVAGCCPLSSREPSAASKKLPHVRQHRANVGRPDPGQTVRLFHFNRRLPGFHLVDEITRRGRKGRQPLIYADKRRSEIRFGLQISDNLRKSVAACSEIKIPPRPLRPLRWEVLAEC